MTLTAAQRRYLDKLDLDDLADHLGFTEQTDELRRTRSTLVDTLDAVRRHHEASHPGGPIGWCVESPCHDIDWSES